MFAKHQRTIRPLRWLWVVLGLLIVVELVTCASAQRVATAGPPPLGFSWSDDTDGTILVDEVTPGSPISRAGLMKGDIITTVDGKPVPSGKELDRIVRRVTAKEQLAIRVKRGEKMVDLKLSGVDPTPAADGKVGILGAILKMDDQDRIHVAEVAPNTPALKAGVKIGDILLKIDERHAGKTERRHRHCHAASLQEEAGRKGAADRAARRSSNSASGVRR